MLANQAPLLTITVLLPLFLSAVQAAEKAAHQTVDGIAGYPVFPDCADIDIGNISMLELATRAHVVITGVALAAGPGWAACDKAGNLGVEVDNSTEPKTNFLVVGIQCVNKGLVTCRMNEDDTNDCLIVIEAPIMTDIEPCSMAQGERYIFFLQPNANGCAGHYYAMYQRVYHTIRRPLGGTGCTFYPCYPAAEELHYLMGSICDKAVDCEVDSCNPLITRSPCANDTSLSCKMKTCPGKFMYHNAILPTETCYEVYSYKTSGLPTHCYGQRYINNRIRELAKLQNASDALQQQDQPIDDESYSTQTANTVPQTGSPGAQKTSMNNQHSSSKDHEQDADDQAGRGRESTAEGDNEPDPPDDSGSVSNGDHSNNSNIKGLSDLLNKLTASGDELDNYKSKNNVDKEQDRDSSSKQQSSTNAG